MTLSSTASLAVEQTFPFTGRVNADNVNIRAGQSKNFDHIGTLQRDDTVVVIQKNYSWYKIRLPKTAQCYVYRELVHFLRDQIGEMTGSRVNVRARPQLNASVLGQLNKMTRVRIVETLDEWYRIEPVEGIYGWVLDEYIDYQSGQVPEPAVVQLPSRNIYEMKRKEEQRRAQEEARRLAREQASKIRIRGTVRLIEGRSTDSHVRHQMTSDEGKTFCLMGYRSILDGFLNHRVQIEGVPQEDSRFAHPVLLVTQVRLVL